MIRLAMDIRAGPGDRVVNHDCPLTVGIQVADGPMLDIKPIPMPVPVIALGLRYPSPERLL